MTKIKLILKPNSISSLIERIKDLLTLSSSVKIKIDKSNIFVYSRLGNHLSTVAFKNYLLNTEDYIDNIDAIGDYTLGYVIANANAFIKNLAFIENNKKVVFEMTYKEGNEKNDLNISIRNIKIIGDRLKINWMGAEDYEVKDITKETLLKMTDITYRDWFFTLTGSDFDDIKKLSKINHEKTLMINTKNGTVKISERGAWELEVDSISNDIDKVISLSKDFLKSINSNKSIIFSIFKNFILIKDEHSNLLLSFEQDHK